MKQTAKSIPERWDAQKALNDLQEPGLLDGPGKAGEGDVLCGLRLDRNNAPTIWRCLERMADSGYRLRRRTIRPFHVLAIWLLDTWLRLEECQRAPGVDADRPYSIRRLVEWLLDVCDYRLFWAEGIDQLRVDRCSPEEALRWVWELVRKHRETGLLDVLEGEYGLGSRSAVWLLRRYELGAAWSILRWLNAPHLRHPAWPWVVRLHLVGCYGALSALLGRLTGVARLLLANPLFLGIILGWLVLPQADEVVKWALSSSPARIWVVGAAICSISILVLVRSAFDLGIAMPWRKTLMVFVLALGYSVVVGFLTTWALGSEWVAELQPESAQGMPPYSALTRGGVLVSAWAPMSVFIGIFTQVVWTGRSPMEPLDTHG